jgi:hypothetical protein
MKALLVFSLLLISTSASAECVRTAAGRTVCRGAEGAVVAPSGAVVRPAPAAQAYPGGVRTVEGAYGGGAAYNPRTGNAAVSQTNANGVKSTETRAGGEAKTKNGMGVVQGPGGKTCAKGRGEAKCN